MHEADDSILEALTSSRDFIVNDTRTVHTGQFFFAEDLYKQVAVLEPYVHDRTHRVTNDEDHDYLHSGDTVLNITEAVANDITQGLLGSITVVVNNSASYPDSGPGPRGSEATGVMASIMGYVHSFMRLDFLCHFSSMWGRSC